MTDAPTDPAPAETAPAPVRRERTERVRMSGRERREQLSTSVASCSPRRASRPSRSRRSPRRRGVSKPVVYEHFGSKDGLYAVIVDREMNVLLGMVSDSLTAEAAPAACSSRPRAPSSTTSRPAATASAILVRDSPVAQNTGNFASLLRDVASQVEERLAARVRAPGLPRRSSRRCTRNMLVGMVALTGQWWLDVRKPKKDEVVAHVVNLAWNGIVGLEKKPQLVTDRGRR